MTEHNKLISGVALAAWGYIFLLFNIFINGFNLLPNFVGYLLLFAALLKLDARPQPAYLRILCLLLVICDFLDWFFNYMAMPGTFWLFLFFMAADICFRFGFLTVMSELAADYQPEGANLSGDIMRFGVLSVAIQLAAVVGSMLAASLALEFLSVVLIIMVIGGALIGLLVVFALFELRKILAASQIKETL